MIEVHLYGWAETPTPDQISEMVREFLCRAAPRFRLQINVEVANVVRPVDAVPIIAHAIVSGTTGKFPSVELIMLVNAQQAPDTPVGRFYRRAVRAGMFDGANPTARMRLLSLSEAREAKHILDSVRSQQALRSKAMRKLAVSYSPAHNLYGAAYSGPCFHKGII